MKKQLLLIPSLIFFGFCTSKAQNLKPDVRPPVFINGNLLQNAWTGGVNSPVISQIDLNGDGKLDLLTFDVNGDRLSCYLNIGQPSQAKYRYAPQYLSKFPANLHGWLRTYDFDCDGDLDIFTYGNAAMTVYKNNYTPVMGLKFALHTQQVNTNYGSIQSNLYVNTVTIPALIDVDSDGDMDVLAFPVSGSWIEYHKNFAMDSTGNCDGFLFHIQFHFPSQYPEMWAHFFLSALANKGILGVQKPSPEPPGDISYASRSDQSNLHSGSSLWAFDYECDNDIDVLNGDLLGSNLLLLQNGGPPDSMVYQDTLFPSYNTPVQMENIPCPSLLDVDNDGKKDLIVTPFANIGEDYNNVWYYRNQGDNCNPDYDLTTTRFLADQMIDVGTSARPAFFDVDNDGLQDMLIANHQYYNNANPSASWSRLAYFRNTGTSTFPVFSLVNTDYANCSSLGILGLHPAFGDLDGDMDKDMLLGTADGYLIYYRNTAGAGNPAVFVFDTAFYKGIDVGNNSAPQIIDMDHDGLPDLLIGERSGNLNYYHNIGTSSSPLFDTPNANFGGVSVLKANALVGNSIPLVFNNSGTTELLVGSESGYIYQFNNIDGNLGGTFNLLDSTYQDIYEPSNANLAMTDIDGDSKFDLLIGCKAGGVRLYTQRNPVNIQPPHQYYAYEHAKLENESVNDPAFTLHPSPTADYLNITIKDMDSGFSIEIRDVLGKRVIKMSSIIAAAIVDVSTLDAGIYFVQVKSDKGENVQKFIKQ